MKIVLVFCILVLSALLAFAEQDACSNHPCKNGSSCIITAEGYHCICKPGFKGSNCEQDTTPPQVDLLKVLSETDRQQLATLKEASPKTVESIVFHSHFYVTYPNGLKARLLYVDDKSTMDRGVHAFYLDRLLGFNRVLPATIVDLTDPEVQQRWKPAIDEMMKKSYRARRVWDWTHKAILSVQPDEAYQPWHMPDYLAQSYFDGSAIRLADANDANKDEILELSDLVLFDHLTGSRNRLDHAFIYDPTERRGRPPMVPSCRDPKCKVYSTLTKPGSPTLLYDDNRATFEFDARYTRDALARWLEVVCTYRKDTLDRLAKFKHTLGWSFDQALRAGDPVATPISASNLRLLDQRLDTALERASKCPSF